MSAKVEKFKARRLEKKKEIELKEMSLSEHKSLSDTKNKTKKKDVKKVEEETCDITHINTNEQLTQRRNFFIMSFPIGEIHKD